MNGVLELEVMPCPVGATTAEDHRAAETRRLVDLSHRMPEIRVEKIYDTRRLIARGGFETPDRIEGTVQRLLEELGCQAGSPIEQKSPPIMACHAESNVLCKPVRTSNSAVSRLDKEGYMASKLPAGLGERWKRVVYLDHRGEVYFVVYEEKEDPKDPEEVVRPALVGSPARSPSEATSALV